MNIIFGVSFEPLLKARANFEKFKQNLTDEQYKAGAIQAFEYTYELAWKTMRKILLERGKEFNSPREVFRAAGLEGFIKDPEIWFSFLHIHAKILDTYDEVIANKVIEVFDSFSYELTLYLEQVAPQALKNRISGVEPTIPT